MGGGLDGTGAAEFALGGGAMSSANKSCCGTLRTCDGPGPGEGLGTTFCEADLSMLCFSFTKFSGISSSPSASNVEGSGIGPSITHLFDSYFVLMKFSILASDGTCPGASFASQYLFALEFPHFNTLCSCSSVHASRSTDLTLLMCVPMPRCIPEHLIQMNMPRFQLAHLGSANSLLSAIASQSGGMFLVAYVCSFCSPHTPYSLPTSGDS